MFSRSGVEFPLVGGPPQRFNGNPGTPSWAWISRALHVLWSTSICWLLRFRPRALEWRAAYRLEKSRLEPPRSCDGEPAPDRGLPPIMLEEESPPTRPNGGLLLEAAVDGSMGELLADGEPERGWLGVCAEYPSGKSPGREVDIINYQVDPMRSQGRLRSRSGLINTKRKNDSIVSSRTVPGRGRRGGKHSRAITSCRAEQPTIIAVGRRRDEQERPLRRELQLVAELLRDCRSVACKDGRCGSPKAVRGYLWHEDASVRDNGGTLWMNRRCPWGQGLMVVLY